MLTYQQFIFESVDFDAIARCITLRYSFDGTTPFVETIQLPKGDWIPGILESPAFQQALLALHIIGGISYYKAALCPELVIKSGELTSDQAHFWDTVYMNGLGELLYRNNIDPARVAHFPTAHVDIPEAIAVSKKGTFLVPFGGGKDSIVTVELLRKAQVSQVLYRNGAHPLIKRSAVETQLPIIYTERTLDPALFALNAEGAINGHVPITTYLSFLSVVIGLLYGFEGVVWSNERSANFGNVRHFGLDINHQWSKSNEAEQLIRTYITRYIASDFRYLNMLRPFSELKIAELFTGYPQYFSSTTSCNKNWKLSGSHPSANQWCGACAKCAFSFLLFTAFLPIEKVTDIFCKNLFDDEALLPLYEELAGFEGIKPFDCVGTPGEVVAAFQLASLQEAVQSTPLFTRLRARIEQQPEDTSWNTLEFPEDFPEIVKKWLSHEA